MQLTEADAKQYLRGFGIDSPAGRLCRQVDEVAGAVTDIGLPVMVKSQAKRWSRGKAGLVRRCATLAEAQTAFVEVQALDLSERDSGEVAPCLVERCVPAEQEFYLAEIVDPDVSGFAIMYSRDGGIDVEGLGSIKRAQLAAGETISRELAREVAEEWGIAAAPEGPDAVHAVLSSLHEAFTASDARLVEVNPLGLTEGGGSSALDAKVVIDDNALRRRPEFVELYRHESPKDTSDVLRIDHGIEYVELDGDIGLISGGAGMTMAVLDLIAERNGRARCFMDCSQNATLDGYGHALDLLSGDPHTAAILINIVGGGTQVDAVAEIFVKLLADGDAAHSGKPIRIRLEGSKSEEAREIMSAAGLEPADSLEAAIDSLVSSLKEAR